MFEGQTILRRIDSSRYEMRSTLSYSSKKYKVVVRPGFVTDGASIPRLFWTTIGCPLNGKYVGSAIIHDGLYGSHRLPRKEIDKLFIDMLKDNGVGFIKRNLMYLGVRSFGWIPYRNKSEDEQLKNKKVVKVLELID